MTYESSTFLHTHTGITKMFTKGGLLLVITPNFEVQKYVSPERLALVTSLCSAFLQYLHIAIKTAGWVISLPPPLPAQYAFFIFLYSGDSFRQSLICSRLLRIGKMLHL